MRVISGQARGRKLKEPIGSNVRPTSDKVKESVFNIIQFDIEGRSVLDLFAGSGQYGIETLSRGAKNVAFVDSSSNSVKLIKENLKICELTDNAVVHKHDAIRYLEYTENYDLIFIDPPYDTKLTDKALEQITKLDKLNVNGIVICEIRKDSPTPIVELPYQLQKEYIYGGVKVIKYTRLDDEN